jgi:hypothetical protein
MGERGRAAFEEKASLPVEKHKQARRMYRLRAEKMGFAFGLVFFIILL